MRSLVLPLACLAWVRGARLRVSVHSSHGSSNQSLAQLHPAAAFKPSRAGLRRALPQMAHKVFIDGEAGTTGLQVRDRLAGRADLEIISLPEEKRKDAAARAEAINAADVAILCLPDGAAIEAAAFVDNDRTVLIDSSTAHRVNPDWDYGFPELSADQRDRIAKSKRIANPGCYPTGFIAATQPLIAAGLLKPTAKLVASAISGYSGGGKGLMEVYEGDEPHEPWGAYGFNLNHKHLPEMSQYSGLESPPIFLPAVGAFAQGMVVSVPIHYGRDLDEAGIAAAAERGQTVGEALHAALSAFYADSRFIEVMPLGEAAWKEKGLLERGTFLRPDTLKDSNKLQIFLYCNDAAETCVIASRLDNLGKGASGAAVQNLNIALGLDESAGLS